MPVISEVSGFIRFADMVDGQTITHRTERTDRFVFSGCSKTAQKPYR